MRRGDKFHFLDENMTDLDPPEDGCGEYTVLASRTYVRPDGIAEACLYCICEDPEHALSIVTLEVSDQDVVVLEISPKDQHVSNLLDMFLRVEKRKNKAKDSNRKSILEDVMRMLAVSIDVVHSR